jgi:serine protease AprX
MRSLSLVAAALLAAAILPAQSLRLEVHSGATHVIYQAGGVDSHLHATFAEVSDLVLRAVPGTPAWIATWTEEDETGASTFTTLTQDGEVWIPARVHPCTLHLRAGTFDPLEGTPAVAPALAASGASDLWIVQFWSPWMPAYDDFLRMAGTEPLLVLHHHARVVRARPVAARLIAAQPCIRWVGPFHPQFRLDEALVEEAISGRSSAPFHTLNVLLFRPGFSGSAAFAEAVSGLGGRMVVRDPLIHMHTVRVPSGLVARLAAHPDVAWIDFWSAPEEDMDIARSVHGAIYVQTVAGFDGTGVRGEVLDGGTEATHPEFQGANPILPHGSLVSGNHGTCTYGQVFATGIDPQARGTCFNGQGIAAYYSGYSGGTRSVHTAELVNPALPWQACFQSNSWGATQTTAYNSSSVEIDTILFQNDILIYQSQSNTGNQNSRPQAWAKNIMSVGGIKHMNTASKADDNWTNGASIGPAIDGRIKPDIASFYDNIYCSDQQGSAGYASGNYYASFGGTSGATPICAGMGGIFFQMWHQGIFGNPTGSTPFASRPKATLAKAMIINTANQWTFSGTSHDLTRTHQGYGHPDLQRIYDDRNKIFWVNETDLLAPFQSALYTVTVNPGETILHATLVYLDPAGAANSTIHRVNNLDLKVTGPGGVIYWGNNGLLAGMSSTPGGTANTVDTVENVIIPNPTPGVWSVEVIAAEVNQDNHLETPVLDVDYALVIRGGITAGGPLGFLFSTVPGTGSVHLELVNIPTGTTEGYCVFSHATAGILGQGPLAGLYPDILSFACLTSPLAAGNPFHFPVPASGLFPEIPFDLPAGALPFPAGSRTDGIAVLRLAGGTFRSTSVTRVTW